MNVSKLIKVELDFYREQCNFTDIETEIFEMRRQGKSLDQIADEKEKDGYTYDGIKKISSAVNEKMRRVQLYFGTF